MQSDTRKGGNATDGGHKSAVAGIKITYQTKEDTTMKRFRNWMEEQTGKRLGWQPLLVGSRGGRNVYAIRFEDGSEEDYFIDFDAKQLELV